MYNPAFWLYGKFILVRIWARIEGGARLRTRLRRAKQRPTLLQLKCMNWILSVSSCLIGVGKGRPSPPSEPCMRFSRTRLSSRWSSSSGLARQCMSFMEGEKPMFSERRRLASGVVAVSATKARTLFPLSQDSA